MRGKWNFQLKKFEKSSFSNKFWFSTFSGEFNERSHNLIRALRNEFCQEIRSMKLSKKNSLMERVSQFYENFLRAWHGTIFAPHHFSKTLVNSIWGVHNTTSQHPLCKYRKDFSAAWGGLVKMVVRNGLHIMLTRSANLNFYDP